MCYIDSANLLHVKKMSTFLKMKVCSSSFSIIIYVNIHPGHDFSDLYYIREQNSYTPFLRKLFLFVNNFSKETFIFYFWLLGRYLCSEHASNILIYLRFISLSTCVFPVWTTVLVINILFYGTYADSMH